MYCKDLHRLIEMIVFIKQKECKYKQRKINQIDLFKIEVKEINKFYYHKKNKIYGLLKWVN